MNADPNHALTDQGDEFDYELLEVREREVDSFGLDRGTAIAKFERTKEYPEDQHEPCWTIEEHSL